MKKIIVKLAICTLLFGSYLPNVAEARNYDNVTNTYYYDAKLVNYPIYRNETLQPTEYYKLNVDGTTYISLRDLARILAVEISWDKAPKSIQIGEKTNSNDSLSSWWNYNIPQVRATEVNFPIYVKGQLKHAEKAKFVVDGITYLSLRDLANMLDVPIDWDNNKKSINITLTSNNKDLSDTGQLYEVPSNKDVSDISDEGKILESPKNKEVPKIEKTSEIPSNKAVEGAGKLADSKIINMGFTQEELDYILSDQLTPYEQAMFDELNKLRDSKGLKRINLSMELTKVARIHSLDIQKNSKEILSMGNMHGWSMSNHWQGGGYPEDHSNAKMMWMKPSELSNYPGYGFEVSFSAGTIFIPSAAINAWNNSPGHREVILTEGQWSDLTSVGLAASSNYACMWFGKE